MVTYLEWIELSCGESKHELKQRHGKVSLWAGTKSTGIVGCPSLHSHNTRKRFQHQEKCNRRNSVKERLHLDFNMILIYGTDFIKL